MAYLILVRHGESEWNALGKFAGITDIALTDAGMKEASIAAENLKDIPLHSAHVSKLKRAKQTLSQIQEALTLSQLPISEHEALNERDYGDVTGLDKKEVRERLGDEEYHKFKRSWDQPIPGGESLKDVHDRVVHYYENHILEDLKAGKNILVVSHHNTLRALMKYLEKLSPDQVEKLELGTAEVRMYEIDTNGEVIGSEVRGGNQAYARQA